MMESGVNDGSEGGVSLEVLPKPDRSQSAAGIQKAARQAVKARTSHLDSTVFAYWYAIIESNQVDKFNEIISSCNDEEIKLLLTGSFLYPFVEDSPKCRAFCFSIEQSCERFKMHKPFILAASFGSVDIFKQIVSLISENDIISVDHDDFNVVHALVLSLHKRQELGKLDTVRPYTSIYNTLMASISHEGRHHLLMQANKKGFRPLELAAHLGQTEFFMTIFKEKDIYRFPQQKTGMMTCVLYDVTDYEAWESNGSRALMSPLRQFKVFHSQISRQSDSTPVNLEIVKEPVMQMWMKTKFRMNTPFMFLQLLLRVGLWLSILFSTPGLENVDISEFNADGPTQTCESVLEQIPSDELLWTSFGVSVLWVLWEGTLIIRLLVLSRRQGYSWEVVLKPEVTLDAMLHKLIFWLIALYAVISPLFRYLVALKGNQIIVLLHSVVSASGVMSLTYILQTIPAIGIYVICVIEMGIVITSFLPVFLLFFASLTGSFMMTSLTVHYCSPYFPTFFVAIYNTFRIMLNLLDPSSFQTSTPDPLYFLHVVFVLLVPILLLNFLIGLMSNAVNTVIGHAEVLFLFNRTQVALTVENETSLLLRGLYALRAHHFFLAKNGRIYIKCFEVEAFDLDTENE